ncbi:hypothetical protein Ade02nite_05790 [Paractinoplanes deccanensis]|uniref:Aminoglycoside phosphotransferase n=1 Tax=Paractinoplanes deccanensis TaxID=113561 RepID=A0ABQ3XW09_9ACTN|nr:phosphotransferase [Actinoplanes deccanensis]GID71938.1 hypothetical protein Ade02nite_05790 [Actinoplanes deccanensis]
MDQERRPRLTEAPEAVRAAVERLLGEPVHEERAAAAGFTASVASTVVGIGGRRLFVKAAPVGGGLGEAVEAGAVLAEAVGDLGPRPAGFAAVGAWRVAAYEAIEGEAVTRWTAADEPELLSVMKRMRTVMEPSPVGGTSPYAEAFVPLLGTWQLLSGDGGPRVDHLRGKPLPVEVPVRMLAELESRWLPALAAGTALHHGDLRRDNVMRQPDGRLRVVDWTHLWTAPGWMDLVRLGPDVAACGLDPEKLLRKSPWADAPAGDVNTALAGLAGRAWREGLLPGPARLRHMQREQALHLLRWLEARLNHRKGTCTPGEKSLRSGGHYDAHKDASGHPQRRSDSPKGR